MTLSSDSFRRAALRRFRYLVTEFEFVVLPREAGEFADAFLVAYQKGSLIVRIQGAHYGHGAQLTLHWDTKKTIGFGHLFTLRKPAAESRPWDVHGQPEQLKAYAVALRASADDILAGDLSYLPVVWEHQMRLHRERRQEEARKHRNLRRRQKRAEKKATTTAR